MKTKLLSLIISLFACSLLVAQEQPIQKVDVNGVYLFLIKCRSIRVAFRP